MGTCSARSACSTRSTPAWRPKRSDRDQSSRHTARAAVDWPVANTMDPTRVCRTRGWPLPCGLGRRFIVGRVSLTQQRRRCCKSTSAHAIESTVVAKHRPDTPSPIPKHEAAIREHRRCVKETHPTLQRSDRAARSHPAQRPANNQAFGKSQGRRVLSEQRRRTILPTNARRGFTRVPSCSNHGRSSASSFHTTPIGRVNPRLDAARKRREWPFSGTFDQAVLYRIVVDVIEVPLEIFLVADHMFPEPPLPHASLSSLPPGVGDFGFAPAACKIRRCKSFLYPPPTRWVVGVSARQGPQGVQMVRQQHNRLDLEWPLGDVPLRSRREGSLAPALSSRSGAYGVSPG